MITPEDIKEIMGRKAKEVCDTVVEDNRANATDEKVMQFIVVSLPYSAMNKTVGEDDDWWVDMTVVYEAYVADKKSANKPNRTDSKAMKKLRQDIFGLFPIVDEEKGVKITRPRTIINSASDGRAFHFTRIQARMTTMV